LKITKGKSEAINAMTKRKNTKEQTMIYKTLHRKLKIEQTELTGNELICHEMGGNSCSTNEEASERRVLAWLTVTEYLCQK
jgi:hypothetical protein